MLVIVKGEYFEIPVSPQVTIMWLMCGSFVARGIAGTETETMTPKEVW